MSPGIKKFAVLYIFILVGIIVLAGIRETQFLFQPIRGIRHADKVSHFLLMGFLSFLVNLALNARSFGVWKIRYLLGSTIVFIVVAIEEFSQLYIRGRTYDRGDLVADLLGIVLFGELARIVCRYRSGKYLSREKTG